MADPFLQKRRRAGERLHRHFPKTQHPNLGQRIASGPTRLPDDHSGSASGNSPRPLHLDGGVLQSPAGFEQRSRTRLSQPTHHRGNAARQKLHRHRELYGFLDARRGRPPRFLDPSNLQHQSQRRTSRQLFCPGGHRGQSQQGSRLDIGGTKPPRLRRLLPLIPTPGHRFRSSAPTPELPPHQRSDGSDGQYQRCGFLATH